jgi:hypothetical protein
MIQIVLYTDYYFLISFDDWEGKFPEVFAISAFQEVLLFVALFAIATQQKLSKMLPQSI